METNITIEPALHGNVKVSIEVAGQCFVFVWRMTEQEARTEAEEVACRMGR